MLFDASAIMNLFGSDRSATLLEGSTIDLAFYEVGNSIRRKVCVEKLLTMQEGTTALDSLTDVMTAMVEAKRANHRDVLDAACQGNLTFYDASYLCAAEAAKATLVTDDTRLFAAGKKRMKVLRSADVPHEIPENLESEEWLMRVRGSVEFESEAVKEEFPRESRKRE
jgi:predicted nucleic acid-binding protein